MSAQCATNSSTNSIQIPTSADVAPIWSKRKLLRAYSKCVCFCVLCLILVGALVTSNNAGLSVPDWPTTSGENMFTFAFSKWQGGIFYEHGHRLLASGVGFLTLTLAIWIWSVEERKFVKVLAGCALGAVILQGVLGGLTVLMKLPPAVSASHGILGQTFFTITVLIAYFLSREWSQRAGEKKSVAQRSIFRIAVGISILVYLQLIAGAVMRHTFSGIAIPDFPTMGGEWIPRFDKNMLDTINGIRATLFLAPIGMFNVVIHFIHRVGAAIIVTCVIVLLSIGVKNRKQLPPTVMTSMLYLAIAVSLQATLGIATVLSVRDPATTSFHVMVGAGLLGLSVLLALRSYQPVKD